MYEHMTIKDIVEANQRFDKGTVLNQSSLDFAVKEANMSKSWLRSCAVLVRAILIDHIFEEGNKRTTASIIVGYLEREDIEYCPEEVARAVTTILVKNITSITKIEKVIANVII